jgi:hypothetical protein
MHEKLILYGIRYRPNYQQDIETTNPEIPGEAFLPRLIEAFQRGSLLDKEQVLLDAKLNTIVGALRKGTLIYTHYLLKTAYSPSFVTLGLKAGRSILG